MAGAPPHRRPDRQPFLGLRGPRRLVAPGALLAGSRRAARAVCRRPRLHPCRVDAGDAASVCAVVGISGQRVLRAPIGARGSGRLQGARRCIPRGGHRRAARLGARALPARRLGAGPVRRNRPVRAPDPPRSAPRLGNPDLQPLPERGPEFLLANALYWVRDFPRRRAACRRRRLDALSRLLAQTGGMGPEQASIRTRPSTPGSPWSRWIPRQRRARKL